MCIDLAGLSGWLDTVSPPPTADQSELTLPLTQGAWALLECRPRVNYPASQARVAWTRDGEEIVDHDVTSTGSDDHVILEPWWLVVRSFSPSGGRGEALYQCRVLGLEHHAEEVRRTFNLSLTQGEGFWGIH